MNSSLTAHHSPKLDDLDKVIIQCLSRGMRAKEIARQIHRSHRTVEQRTESLRKQFLAKNTTHLVALLIKEIDTINYDDERKIEEKSRELLSFFDTAEAATQALNQKIERLYFQSKFWYDVKISLNKNDAV